VSRAAVAFPIVLLALSSSAKVHAGCRGTAEVNAAERRAFLDAAYGTADEVRLEALAQLGCTKEVLERLRQLGAAVLFVDAKVGYVFLKVPRGEVLDVLDIPGIAFASASGSVRNFEKASPASIPASVPRFSIAFSRVAREVSKNGPYFPADEAGLTALWSLHPKADGRGARVAVLDSGFDMLHPALLLGRDMAGKLVPKVADIVPPLDTDDGLLDPNWVSFGPPLHAARGTFTEMGRLWIAPSPGTYRFGVYSRVLRLPQASGSAVKLNLAVGVLWSESRGRVWVDTDGDRDFRDEHGVRDYAVAHEFVFFGSKSALGDNRIPFGIKIDTKRARAFLAISNSSHGTDIAGPLAANRFSGGLFTGAAPSAQLIDVRTSLNPGLPLLVGLLRAFRRKDVDIVNRSGYLAGQELGNEFDDGRGGFERHIVERAVTIYDKPIVCYCGAKGSLYVNDYQSVEMLRRNRQAPPPLLEAMDSDVWFKPDGLVNTVLGPSTSLVATSRYFPFDFPGFGGKRGISAAMLTPPAPAGYSIGSNNSPTISLVSGVLADLVEEAKRRKVRFGAMRLLQAVFTGTTWVDGFPASAQGFGLVNGAGAWQQLVGMSRADDPRNPMVTSFSIYAKEQIGLQEINGFHKDVDTPDETFDGSIWIARRGGYSGTRLYAVALRGNDGTFRLARRTVELTRDEPEEVRFNGQATPGMHVAFLQLRDLRANVVMQEVPLSVRVPESPAIVAPGVERYDSVLPPRRLKQIYVRVREAAQAVRYTMDVPYAGPMGAINIRAMPGFRWGVKKGSFVATDAPGGEPLNALHHVGPMQEFASMLRNDSGGLRVITWDNRGEPEYETPYDPPAPDVPIQGALTVTSYAVAFSNPKDGVVEVTNKLAAVRGNVEFFKAKVNSSGNSGQGSHATASFLRTVPGRLSEWRIKVTAEGLARDEADVFVFHCVGWGRGCSVVAQRTNDGTSVVIEDPKQGEWMVLIRARANVAGAVFYRTNEAFVERIPVLDGDEERIRTHPSSEIWRVVLPQDQNVSYAAFHLTECCGEQQEAEALRIGVSALDADLP
jgi:hypothetical protein